MDVISFLTFCASIGCGVVGGVFFAFSTFVARALADLPEESSVAAMQRINVAALSPPFMIAFLGSALVCAVLIVYGAFAGERAVTLGGAVYLVGTFAVTVFFHVPRNHAIAKWTPGAGSHWRRYLSAWVAANHARTVSSILATGIFIVVFAGS